MKGKPNSGSIWYNCVSKSTDSLQPWEPTPEQRYAAQLLAAGKTWQETADEVGVGSLTTIARWLNTPSFRSLVNEYTERISRALESQLQVALGETFHLWRRMVLDDTGELARDPRLDRIQRVVEKYLDPASTPIAPLDMLRLLNPDPGS